MEKLTDCAAIGKAIELRMNELDVGKGRIAHLAEMSHNTLTNIIKGHPSNIRSYIRICRILGISFIDLCKDIHEDEYKKVETCEATDEAIDPVKVRKSESEEITKIQTGESKKNYGDIMSNLNL